MVDFYILMACEAWEQDWGLGSVLWALDRAIAYANKTHDARRGLLFSVRKNRVVALAKRL